MDQLLFYFKLKVEDHNQTGEREGLFRRQNEAVERESQESVVIGGRTKQIFGGISEINGGE